MRGEEVAIWARNGLNFPDLGTQGNETFLDKFRFLISEIGNAMGYVRMVKAGGMHQSGLACECLPDLPLTPSLPDGASLALVRAHHPHLE